MRTSPSCSSRTRRSKSISLATAATPTRLLWRDCSMPADLSVVPLVGGGEPASRGDDGGCDVAGVTDRGLDSAGQACFVAEPDHPVVPGDSGVGRSRDHALIA